jgi:hypothetical protein
MAKRPVTASGETELSALIAGMAPVLHDDVFVFSSVKSGEMPAGICPLLRFEEAEGVTLILRRSEAAQLGLAYEFSCRMITLNVHSALEAVGFLAAIASQLAKHGISANTVSAFYHDHLFVPEDRAEAALKALQALGSDPGLRAARTDRPSN